jgi:hypothetical protein
MTVSSHLRRHLYLPNDPFDLPIELTRQVSVSYRALSTSSAAQRYDNPIWAGREKIVSTLSNEVTGGNNW